MSHDRYPATMLRSRSVAILVALLGVLLAAVPALATTVVPLADTTLRDRADVIVHGVVVSSVVAEEAGRPVTVTTIRPMTRVKGLRTGDLVLHQLGGMLSDGSSIKMHGAPEYLPGHEVLVFAIARPGGGYQTAEMFLGHFHVQADSVGVKFAVPSAASSVNVVGGAIVTTPRELTRFIRLLRRQSVSDSVSPRGALRTVIDPTLIGPQPFNLNFNTRWTNDATVSWNPNGVVNGLADGGAAALADAIAVWNDEPNSNINYSVNPNGSSQTVFLNAFGAPCGWNTCVGNGGGVVGCATVGGFSSHTWRGETYNTASFANVWLRASCDGSSLIPNLIRPILVHEFGHTLGLGHADQGDNPHDVCKGDEAGAIMGSIIGGSRSSLGTDDSDAVRWLYGDGGVWCSGPPTPTSVTIAPSTFNAFEAGALASSFAVIRTQSTAAALVVNYTVGGTAIPGADYLALPGSVTIPAGSPSALIVLTPVDDTLIESPETVTVTLAAGAGYSVGTRSSATVTITDNDSAPPPGAATLVASPPTVPVGGAVLLTWQGSTSTGDWIGLYAPGADSRAYIMGVYTNGAGTGAQSFQLPASLPARAYEFKLLFNKGYTVLATSNKVIVGPLVPDFPPPSGAVLTAKPVTIVAGGTATATWAGVTAPHSGDWIALYAAGAPNNHYLAYRYTTGSASGSLTLDIPPSLLPGAYELRLLGNNQYTVLATSNAVVIAALPPAPPPTLTAAPTTVTAGGSVTATWAGIAQPVSGDWIGLYAAGSASNRLYLVGINTTGAASGSLTMPIPSTLPPGQYELRLLANKGYTSLATSNAITVAP